MDEQACRRILEVSDQASMDEIQQAYHLLKRLYGNEQALFAVPSMEEFAPENRAEILQDIESAYQTLCRILEQAKVPVQVVPVALPEDHRPVDGRTLRSLREASGATLEYLASQTHVRLDYLRALEEERFWDLPLAAVNVRGFLTAYVTEIGLPVEQVVSPYMDRFLKWQARRGR